MKKLSIDLPTKYRLDLRLIKRRGKDVDELPNINVFKSISKTRKGNKISRLFRHVFENKKIKKILGTNLVILAFTASFIPQNQPIASEIQEETQITNAPYVFTTQAGTQFPLEEIKITQTYKFYHPGIDLDGQTGDYVKPITSGVVASTSYSRFGYGNAIIVDHGNKIHSLYAHLSKIYVSEGEKVNNNSVLGELGSTGRAFGDHLHLEVYENSKTINPLSVLPRI